VQQNQKSFEMLKNTARLIWILITNFRRVYIFPPSYKKLKNLSRFLKEVKSFQKAGGTIDTFIPILNEHSQSAGVVGGHYFHQDLLVAQFIKQANPKRHIDVGSRIDGFVAHVASFRKIEILDIRNFESSEHENLVYTKSDLMELQPNTPKTDSLSCLHTIEHFGLGRYGDAINPSGHIVGFNNLIKMLEPNGNLYVSFPIGTKTKVCFNAHRIFNPLEILTWAPEKVQLIRFDYVDDGGKLHKNFDLNCQIEDLNYGCGIYTFKKTISSN
jgi:hypothetical protein